jgi:hypothetical protein
VIQSQKAYDQPMLDASGSHTELASPSKNWKNQLGIARVQDEGAGK